MNKREPGEKFTEEAKPFVEEIREMAAHSYEKIMSLGHDLGQKFQKTFNPAPGLGGSTNRHTPKSQEFDDDTNEDSKKD